MESSSIVMMVITVAFIALSLYILFETFKRYQRYKKNLREFFAGHQDYRDINHTRWHVLSMIFLAAVIIGFCILAYLDGIESAYMVVYACLGLLFLGLAIDNLMRYRCLLTDDGFYYLDQYYRYRSVREVKFKEGLFKKGFIVLNKNEEIPCTYKIAQILKENQQIWKKHKKRK